MELCVARIRGGSGSEFCCVEWARSSRAYREKPHRRRWLRLNAGDVISVESHLFRSIEFPAGFLHRSQNRTDEH
jgi:hypothetical protein